MSVATMGGAEFGDFDALDAELALANQIGITSVMDLVDIQPGSVGGGIAELPLSAPITGLNFFQIEHPDTWN